MALAGTGKWESLGAAMVRCAGPNFDKLRAGIDAGITVENARTGNGQMQPKKRPGRKKQAALLKTT